MKSSSDLGSEPFQVRLPSDDQPAGNTVIQLTVAQTPLAPAIHLAPGDLSFHVESHSDWVEHDYNPYTFAGVGAKYNIHDNFHGQSIAQGGIEGYAQAHDGTYTLNSDATILECNKYNYCNHSFKNTYYQLEKSTVPLVDQGNKFNDFSHSWFSKVLSFIAPLFLAFGWVNFFESFIHLTKAKKENLFSRLSDCILSFLTAAGTTIIFALTLAAIPGIIYAAPYVLGVIIGLNILRRLYQFGKSLVKAWDAHTNKQKDYEKERNQHLKAAGLHLLSIITNILSLVAIVYVFKAFQLKTHTNLDASYLSSMDPSTAVNAGQFGNNAAQYLQSTIVDSANAFSNTAFNLLISIFTLAIPGLVLKAWQTNKESLDYLRGKKKFSDTFEAKALQRMKSVFDLKNKTTNLGIKIAKLLVSPLVVASYGLTAAAHLLLRSLSMLVLGVPQILAHVINAAMLKKNITALTNEISEELPEKIRKLNEKIAAESKEPNKSEALKKHQGQKLLLTGIQRLLADTATTISDNKLANRGIKTENRECYFAIKALESRVKNGSEKKEQTAETAKANSLVRQLEGEMNLTPDASYSNIYHKKTPNKQSNTKHLAERSLSLLAHRHTFFHTETYLWEDPDKKLAQMRALSLINKPSTAS